MMDVSVDVTVTKVEADIIDDGIPMEDIDDMEIDFFFSKCDNLDLDTPMNNGGQKKKTDIIELSDDEEVNKDMPNDVQTKVQTEKKTAVSSSMFRKIPPKLPVIKIPKAQVNRRFKIAIQSNIQITNNDFSSVTPTVAYTVSTKPIVQTQSDKRKPKFVVIEKKDNPKTDQIIFKDINVIKKLYKKETKDSNVPQNNKILLTLLNQKSKPLTLNPVSSHNVKPKGLILESNYLQYLKQLAETPSTSKDTLNEPPITNQKHCYNLESKNAIIKEDIQIMNAEEIPTKKLGYRVSKVGGFNAVHDASGAIVEMIEETPDSPEESQENFIDKKLLSVTTVQLDDWSAVLSNSTRYCSLCQTLFPSRAVLDEHQAQWHPLLVPCVEEEGYYCQHCDTSFYNKTSLETHSQTHQNTTHAPTNNAKFKCFICRRGFASRRGFYAHVNAKHMQSLSCHCGKEFPLRELLDDHIRTVHGSRPSADTISDELQDRKEGKEVQEVLVQTTALFQCESCEVNFTCYNKAKAHYACCDKSKRIGYKCSQCQKLIDRFDRTHRRQHNLKCDLKTYTVNSKKLDVISECPKCYSLQVQKEQPFVRHVMYCNGPGAVFAECCGFKFTEMRYLNHVEQHHANRDFILVKYALYDPKLDSESLEKTKDRAWKKRHQYQKAKKCPICGVLCKRGQKGVERHMVIHSSKRPFKCEKCPFSTKRSSDLLRHRQKFCYETV